MEGSNKALDLVKNMAKSEQGRHLVIHDDVLFGGLVMLLSNPDLSIVRDALETLLMLSHQKTDKSRMRDFIGLMEQLETVRNGPMPDLKELAENIEKNLTEDSGDVLREKLINKSKHTPIKSAKKKHRNVFLTRTKVITLHIKGLHHKTDSDACHEVLIRVKGVISVTCNIPKQRCIIRAKLELEPEILVHAIASTETMSAEQVVRDETGREVFLSFGAKPLPNKENYDMPPYLEDDDSPVKEKGAISRFGEESDAKSGWFGKVGNFISNSLYWNY
ncbi:unnamed protein product [Owenia fusiformis]|uniref:Uncharacterized protein n=1 Tax=Owenia fusiformis TaxID=6347 RepID=A0A8J1YAZ9_OWEFU|nr:unnamed protein product [Owenia fusiformis]